MLAHKDTSASNATAIPGVTGSWIVTSINVTTGIGGGIGGIGGIGVLGAGIGNVGKQRPVGRVQHGKGAPGNGRRRLAANQSSGDEQVE